jgi:hypothetical protein
MLKKTHQTLLPLKGTTNSEVCSRFKIAKMQHPEIVQIPVLTVSLANLQQNIVFFLATIYISFE